MNTTSLSYEEWNRRQQLLQKDQQQQQQQQQQQKRPISTATATATATTSNGTGTTSTDYRYADTGSSSDDDIYNDDDDVNNNYNNNTTNDDDNSINCKRVETNNNNNNNHVETFPMRMNHRNNVSATNCQYENDIGSDNDAEDSVNYFSPPVNHSNNIHDNRNVIDDDDDTCNNDNDENEQQQQQQEQLQLQQQHVQLTMNMNKSIDNDDDDNSIDYTTSITKNEQYNIDENDLLMLSSCLALVHEQEEFELAQCQQTHQEQGQTPNKVSVMDQQQQQQQHSQQDDTTNISQNDNENFIHKVDFSDINHNIITNTSSNQIQKINSSILNDSPDDSPRLSIPSSSSSAPAFYDTDSDCDNDNDKAPIVNSKVQLVEEAQVEEAKVEETVQVGEEENEEDDTEESLENMRNNVYTHRRQQLIQQRRQQITDDEISLGGLSATNSSTSKTEVPIQVVVDNYDSVQVDTSNVVDQSTTTNVNVPNTNSYVYDNDNDNDSNDFIVQSSIAANVFVPNNDSNVYVDVDDSDKDKDTNNTILQSTTTNVVVPKNDSNDIVDEYTYAYDNNDTTKNHKTQQNHAVEVKEVPLKFSSSDIILQTIQQQEVKQQQQQQQQQQQKKSSSDIILQTIQQQEVKQQQQQQQKEQQRQQTLYDDKKEHVDSDENDVDDDDFDDDDIGSMPKISKSFADNDDENCHTSSSFYCDDDDENDIDNNNDNINDNDDYINNNDNNVSSSSNINNDVDSMKNHDTVDDDASISDTENEKQQYKQNTYSNVYDNRCNDFTPTTTITTSIRQQQQDTLADDDDDNDDSDMMAVDEAFQVVDEFLNSARRQARTTIVPTSQHDVIISDKKTTSSTHRDINCVNEEKKSDSAYLDINRNISNNNKNSSTKNLSNNCDNNWTNGILAIASMTGIGVSKSFDDDDDENDRTYTSARSRGIDTNTSMISAVTTATTTNGHDNDSKSTIRIDIDDSGCGSSNTHFDDDDDDDDNDEGDNNAMAAVDEYLSTIQSIRNDHTSTTKTATTTISKAAPSSTNYESPVAAIIDSQSNTTIKRGSEELSETPLVESNVGKPTALPREISSQQQQLHSIGHNDTNGKKVIVPVPEGQHKNQQNQFQPKELYEKDTIQDSVINQKVEKTNPTHTEAIGSVDDINVNATVNDTTTTTTTLLDDDKINNITAKNQNELKNAISHTDFDTESISDQQTSEISMVQQLPFRSDKSTGSDVDNKKCIESNKGLTSNVETVIDVTIVENKADLSKNVLLTANVEAKKDPETAVLSPVRIAPVVTCNSIDSDVDDLYIDDNNDDGEETDRVNTDKKSIVNSSEDNAQPQKQQQILTGSSAIDSVVSGNSSLIGNSRCKQQVSSSRLMEDDDIDVIRTVNTTSRPEDSWLMTASSFDVNFDSMFKQDFGSDDNNEAEEDKEYLTIDEEDEYKGDDSEYSIDEDESDDDDVEPTDESNGSNPSFQSTETTSATSPISALQSPARDSDPEEIERRRQKTLAIANILKTWDASVKPESDVPMIKRKKVNGRTRTIRSRRKSRPSRGSFDGEEDKTNGRRSVAFAELPTDDKPPPTSNEKRRRKNRSLQKKKLPEGMKLVKVKRQRPPPAAPKLLGGLALMENNETMKLLSKVEYSRRLWVEEQIKANKMEWKYYKETLRDILHEATQIKELIKSFHGTLAQYSLAIDYICRDVYVNKDGELLESEERDELQASGYVSTSLRSSTILNPILQSFNRLRDELDCYLPMIETSTIDAQLFYEDIVTKVALYDDRGEQIVDYVHAVEAEDDVKKSFILLMTATGSFGNRDETTTSASDNSETGGGWSESTSALLNNDRWVCEAGYCNSSRMARFLWILNRIEFQQLMKTIILFDLERYNKWNSLLQLFIPCRDKFLTKANTVLCPVTDTFESDIKQSRDIEINTIEESICEILKSKMTTEQLEHFNAAHEDDDNEYRPDVDLIELGNDVSESGYVEERKMLEVLVGSEWQLAFGVVTRDHYLHIFITPFVTDESIFDYDRITMESLSHVIKSITPDSSFRLTNCTIQSSFDLTELNTDGADCGIIDPRKITLMPKVNTSTNVATEGSRFGLFRKKQQQQQQTQQSSPDKDQQHLQDETSELTIRLRSENEAWLLVNSIKCIIANAENEAKLIESTADKKKGSTNTTKKKLNGKK